MFRLVERLSAYAMTVAGWCYLLITGLICFDIVARRLFGFSTESTVELSGYLLAIGMSWGMAGTLFERAHVRIDVLLQRFPASIRAWFHLASLLALLVSMAVFAYGASNLARDSFELGSTDLSSLHIPMTVPQGMWAAGLVMMLLAILAIAGRALRQLLVGEYEEMDRMLMARTYVDETAETLEAVAQARQGDSAKKELFDGAQR